MRTPITPSQFGQLFQNFKHDAFRLETLDQYLVPEEQQEFERFLSGEALPKSENREWADLVRSAITADKNMTRVHMVKMPLTPYLRFEVAWGYVYSTVAGERIYLLDRSLLPDKALSQLADFWLFDSTILVKMSYAANGAYNGAELDDDPKALSACIVARDQLVKAGIPLREFLAQERNK